MLSASCAIVSRVFHSGAPAGFGSLLSSSRTGNLLVCCGFAALDGRMIVDWRGYGGRGKWVVAITTQEEGKSLDWGRSMEWKVVFFCRTLCLVLLHFLYLSAATLSPSGINYEGQ